MLSALVLLSVSAAPIKVAVTRLNVVDATSARVDFYTEALADRLGDEGLEVTSPREVATLLGFEREKQLLGCEESACVAELAGALGVDALVMGDLAKVGSETHLNLKVLSTTTSRRLAAFTASTRDEDELMKTLGVAAHALAQELSTALGRPLQPRARASASPQPGARRWWWAPALVGLAAGGAGAVGLASAEDARVRLATGGVTLEEAPATLQGGQTARTLGWVGVGVGVAALGTAVGLLLLGEDAPVRPVASVTASGASIAVEGVLP